MTSAAFWAADSIATQMDANAAAIRAASSMRHQQGYHCGDLAVKHAALREIARLDPDNPLLIEAVQETIYANGQREFWRNGWEAGCAHAHEADPHAVFADLTIEFKAKQAELISKVQSEQVQKKRKGWFFINRRDIYIFGKTRFNSQDEAELARAAQLRHLGACTLASGLAPHE